MPKLALQPGFDPALHDLGARLVGIPFVGLTITHLSGVLGPYGPTSRLYWIGCAWFVGLSAILWHANRFALVRLRAHYDWLEQPWRKAFALLAANVVLTVPLSIGMHLGWDRFAGLPVEPQAVFVTTLVITLAAVFVTHIYETAFLIRQRAQDLLAQERLERERAEAELLALKIQVDPHFLFNALTSLAFLIPREPQRAVVFAERLGQVYLYILTNRERNLVPLGEELRFAESYGELLRLRFGDSVRLLREGETDVERKLIPPVSLQVLLENAVKHNAPKPESSLTIRLLLAPDRIEVSNPRSSGATLAPSFKVGLQNLDDRCRRLVGRGLEVRTEADSFTVAVPLVEAPA
jgi:hypothetical protein